MLAWYLERRLFVTDPKLLLLLSLSPYTLAEDVLQKSIIQLYDPFANKQTVTQAFTRLGDCALLMSATDHFQHCAESIYMMLSQELSILLRF